MRGNSANLSAITRLTANQTLEFKYQRRNAEDIGFPDFVKLAEAYGCYGLRCDSPDQVDAVIEKAMAIDDPLREGGFV